MIWLAWRQHRKQALYTALGLLVLALLMIPSGLAMRHTLAHEGINGCLNAANTATTTSRPLSATCNTAINLFTARYKTMPNLGLLLTFLPLVVGLFWGAPLVAREVEQGTHRLVWTQGVSRRRWVLVKFGLVGVATLLASALFGLGMAWWWSPLSRTGMAPRLALFAFDLQGIAPIGYTLFAIALGILAGTIWSRVLPAMAVSIVGYTGVRFAVAALARAHFVAPKVLTFPVLAVGNRPRPNDLSGNWTIATGVRDAQGRLVLPDQMVFCRPRGTGGTCGTEMGLKPGAYNWFQYQPASRFWLLQSIEAGVFVALAAVLLFLAIRRVRRIA